MLDRVCQRLAIPDLVTDLMSIALTVSASIRPHGPGAKRLSGDLIRLNNREPFFPSEDIRSVFRAE